MIAKLIILPEDSELARKLIDCVIVYQVGGLPLDSTSHLLIAGWIANYRIETLEKAAQLIDDTYSDSGNSFAGDIIRERLGN